MARAGELGVDQALTFLREVDAINHAPPRAAWSTSPARRSAARFARHAGRACSGAAFKPNTDDVRDSPALDVAGADPAAGRRRSRSTTREAMDNAAGAAPRRWRYADVRRRGAATDADVVLHLTEWQEFRELDPAVARRGRRRAPRSSTAATPSTRRAGAPPAGPTAHQALAALSRPLSCSAAAAMTEPTGSDERWADPDVIRSLLVGPTVWAVVGLRDNPARPA